MQTPWNMKFACGTPSGPLFQAHLRLKFLDASIHANQIRLLKDPYTTFLDKFHQGNNINLTSSLIHRCFISKQVCDQASNGLPEGRLPNAPENGVQNHKTEDEREGA